MKTSSVFGWAVTSKEMSFPRLLLSGAVDSCVSPLLQKRQSFHSDILRWPIWIFKFFFEFERNCTDWWRLTRCLKTWRARGWWPVRRAEPAVCASSASDWLRFRLVRRSRRRCAASRTSAIRGWNNPIDWVTFITFQRTTPRWTAATFQLFDLSAAFIRERPHLHTRCWSNHRLVSGKCFR